MSATIAGHTVGPIGYGLMGKPSFHVKPIPEEQAFAAMRASLATGCNLWNGGVFYGTPDNNSVTLLSKYYAQYPEDADKVVFTLKGGMKGSKTGMITDSSPENMKEEIERCLQQLGGRGKIDMYECARRDPKVPLRDTLEALDHLVKEGKIGAVSLSEVNANTIREAAAITKIAAVEVDLSLWNTDPLTNGIVQACAELDIVVVAYAPVGRGMLTGQIKSHSDIPKDDFRLWFPRYQAENFESNMKRVRLLEQLAEKKKCTPVQLALGWHLTLSKRPGMPTIIPIPGTTSAERVKENAGAVELTDEDMKEIQVIVDGSPVTGDRYHAAGMAMVDG